MLSIDFDNLPKVVAIVGSREFPRLDWVEICVKRTRQGTIIVSGGARGVDARAEKTARTIGRKYKPFNVEAWEWTELRTEVPHIAEIAYIRNELLVRWVKHYNGHVMLFVVMDDNGEMTGGSNNVREHCIVLGVPYTIITQEGQVTHG